MISDLLERIRSFVARDKLKFDKNGGEKSWVIGKSLDQKRRQATRKRAATIRFFRDFENLQYLDKKY